MLGIALLTMLGPARRGLRVDPIDAKHPRCQALLREPTLAESRRWLHQLNRGVSLYAGISQAFRAPNLSDLTRFDSARSNEVETPAPDLDSEDFLSYELGVKLAGRSGTATVALFHTEIDDLIQRVPTGRVLDGENEITKTNAGEGFVQGIELSGTWRLGGRWSAQGVVTWIDGEADTFPTADSTLVREPLSRLMPPTAHLGLRWQADERLWLELLATVADRQDKLSSRDQGDRQRIPPGGTPGYEVLTLRGAWKLADSVEILAGLENLTDEEYRIHGSGLNEPGRNLVVSLDFAF